MKKLLILLVLSLNYSAQTLTFEEMDLLTKGDLETDTKLLKEKGYVFERNSKDKVGVVRAHFLKYDKDTVEVVLTNNTKRVWEVECHFRSVKAFNEFKKIVLTKGFIFDQKTLNTEQERYNNGERSFIFKKETYGSIGDVYMIQYYNNIK